MRSPAKQKSKYKRCLVVIIAEGVKQRIHLFLYAFSSSFPSPPQTTRWLFSLLRDVVSLVMLPRTRRGSLAAMVLCC